MTPVPAQPADVDDIHALRRSLEDWMAERAVDQWPRGSLPRERVEAQVAAGEWWVVRDDDGLVATIRLLWSDPDFWGADPTPAAYVHGLMVARRRSGDGLGTALLDWAAASGRASGVGLFRLDCRASNPALRRYYEGQGFAVVGERDFGTHRNTLLERPLTTGTIGYLHTSDAHVPTFTTLTAAYGVPSVHRVDPDLLETVRRVGPDDADLARRTRAAVETLVRDGVDVVVSTCSSLAPVVERVDAAVPVVQVDRAMARAAVAAGQVVGVLATLESTVDPTRDLLLDEARRAAADGSAPGADEPTVVPVVVPDAWDAFQAGDAGRCAALVASAARDLAGRVDVVVLAQVSMRGAEDLLADLPVPVLTSPALGVAAAVDLLAGRRA